MTAAQIYSNKNQSKRCIQVLHEVARHGASLLRAYGLAGVPVSFQDSSVTSNSSLVGRYCSPVARLNYNADGIRLPGPVGYRCLLGPGLQGVNGRFPGWGSGQTV